MLFVRIVSWYSRRAISSISLVSCLGRNGEGLPKKVERMRLISLDGGGYLGLATASLIEGLENHFESRLSDTFDLFCGTSTGAIVALGLAIGKTGTDLRKLYIGLGVDVLQNSWGPFWKVARLWTPKYRTEALRTALTGVFEDATLADVHARGKCVVVTSFCLSTGRPRLFKTNHSNNLTRHGGYRLVDIALASAAAPAYFPCVSVADPLSGVVETFCDGGVVTNHPALVAYAEAVSECGVAARDVKLLSVSTPRSNLAQRDPIRLRRGLWHWGEGLAETFIEGGARVSDHVLKRIVRSYPEAERPLYERIELNNAYRLAFDDVSQSATNALILEGSNCASSADVRTRVANFFRKE